MLSLSACSSRLIYNNLDWLTYWYLDDYIELTDEQEERFDPMLNRFLTWHRESQLQQYSQLLQRIKKDVNDGIKEQNIADYMVTVKLAWKDILIRLEPDLVDLSFTLSDQQLNQFLQESENYNLDKIAEQQSLNHQQRLDKRLKMITKRIESYTGKLSEPQKALLKHSNNNVISTFDDWIIYRRAWAESIRSAFDLRSNKAKFETQISSSILHTDRLRSEIFWKKIEYNQQLWIETMVQLVNSLSTKQRNALNDKLDSLIDDLQTLSSYSKK